MNIRYTMFNNLKDMGFEMEKIRQGVYTLSEPMKQLEADLRKTITTIQSLSGV